MKPGFHLAGKIEAQKGEQGGNKCDQERYRESCSIHFLSITQQHAAMTGISLGKYLINNRF
jgi:hypothetical protein